MVDESEAGAAGLWELYADSGDGFVGFDADTVQLGKTTLSQTRRNYTESASDPESSDSGSGSSDGDSGARHTTMPVSGNIRRARGRDQIRCRGRNGDNLGAGPTASDSGYCLPCLR